MAWVKVAPEDAISADSPDIREADGTGFVPVKSAGKSGSFLLDKGEDVGRAGEAIATYGPKLMSLLFQRPAAANRAAIKANPAAGFVAPGAAGLMAQVMPHSQAAIRAREAFMNPDTAPESYGEQNLKTLNSMIDKTQISKMSEGKQTAARFVAGIPAITIGLAQDFLTNPGDAAAAAATDGLGGMIGDAKIAGQTGRELMEAPISSLPRRIARQSGETEQTGRALARLQARGVKEKGQKAVAELLQPGGKEYENALASGRTPGELKEGFNVINETAKPKELVQTFDDEIGKVMDFRDKLIKENNRPVSPKAIAMRAKFELEKKYGRGFNQLEASDRSTVKELFKDELKTILKQGEFDTVKAQARKEFLQNETKGLLGKEARGETVVIDPKSQVVKDAYRIALKDEISSTHPDIAKLNARFDGLDNARDWASKIHRDYMNEPSSFMRRLTQIVGRPNQKGRVAAAVRELPFMSKPLKGDTGKIERLRGQYEALMEKAAPPPGKGTLQYTSDEQALLAPTDAYLQRIMGPEQLKQLADHAHTQEQKLLSQGPNFEMVDPGESAARMRLKKFQDDFEPAPDRNVRDTKTFQKTRPPQYSREGNPDYPEVKKDGELPFKVTDKRGERPIFKSKRRKK